MEDKNFDTMQAEASVENEQVADVQPQAEGVQDKGTNAFYADRRRKQELEESRRTIERLESQLSQQADEQGFIDFINRVGAKKAMEDDLKEIQSIEPKITTLDDLPPMFYTLRFNDHTPMSAKQAFIAMRAIESRTVPPKPVSTGSMNGTGKADSDYFTDSELDNLTAKDLENPKVLEKAMKSMARIR